MTDEFEPSADALIRLAVTFGRVSRIMEAAREGARTPAPKPAWTVTVRQSKTLQGDIVVHAMSESEARQRALGCYRKSHNLGPQVCLYAVKCVEVAS